MNKKISVVVEDFYTFKVYLKNLLDLLQEYLDFIESLYELTVDDQTFVLHLTDTFIRNIGKIIHRINVSYGKYAHYDYFSSTVNEKDIQYLLNQIIDLSKVSNSFFTDVLKYNKSLSIETTNKNLIKSVTVQSNEDVNKLNISMQDILKKYSRS